MKEKKSDGQILNFAYDALDRLTTFENDNQKVVYKYDENNRRLSKTLYSIDLNGNLKEQETIRYLYQGQNEIGAVDKNGDITELRVLGIGKGAEIGAAVAIEVKNKMYVPIHDHIGNVACLLDGASGDIVESYRYSSFGEELFEQAISPWKFCSKRRDIETGFVYFGRRYYAPDIGRWVTPDPIGRDGGPNLYAYVLNSPLTHFDLYGLFGMYDNIKNGFSNLCNFIGNTISKLARVPGQVISLFGKHLVPLPYVKDAIEFGGWCLQGKNPSLFNWKKERSQYIKHEGYGDGDPHFLHVMYFGILVEKDECISRLAQYSKQNGGVTVHGIYNASHGFILDALEVVCQKLGISTHAQEVAEKQTRSLLEEKGEYKEGAVIIATAHSQGAETVHNLSSGLRQRMHVTALSPARILQRDDFLYARNYLAPFDPVPLLDCFGIIKGLRNGNVHYLPTTGCPVIDHYFDNKRFSKIRTISGKAFKDVYGEVW